MKPIFEGGAAFSNLETRFDAYSRMWYNSNGVPKRIVENLAVICGKLRFNLWKVWEKL